MHWRAVDREFVIAPDTPDEASGAYSGCAVPHAGGVRFYYTGNVKEPGDFDYVHDGRRSVQILVESPDGYRMGEKNVLLRNADYPAGLTCHVRDPKVWRDGRTWWMLLGARDATDRALALVLRSDDGVGWESAGSWHADDPLGYMWECPDRVALGGHEWLSICPQGVEGHPCSHGLRDASGYVPLAPGARVADGGTLAAGDFRPWDAGFDFYAPQTFVDEGGRTLLVGWMGLPEAPWESAPDGLSWCHCLTVPREVTAAPDGCLLQRPARELEALRGAARELAAGGELRLEGRRADIEVAGRPVSRSRSTTRSPSPGTAPSLRCASRTTPSTAVEPSGPCPATAHATCGFSWTGRPLRSLPTAGARSWPRAGSRAPSASRSCKGDRHFCTSGRWATAWRARTDQVFP